MKARPQTPTYVSPGASALALLFCAVLCLVFLAPKVAAAPCPNEALREAQDTLYLPECMALEMVSPPAKESQSVSFPSISANGERIFFTSRAALAGTPGLIDPTGDTYLSSRSAGGWSTAPTSPPPPYGNFSRGEPLARTPDFGRWLTESGTEAQLTLGEFGFFEDGLDGLFSPISLLAPLNGPLDAASTTKRSLEGASADFSHLVFTPGGNSTAKAFPYYLPGDPVPSAQNDPNSYVISRPPSGTPTLALLARDSAGKVWGGTCGSYLGGEVGRKQGAISADGTRTFFSTRPAQPQPEADHLALPACDTSNPVRILERTEAPSGSQIAEVAPGGPAGGSDFYEGASVDGSRLYFTTTRSLVGGDGDSGSSCGTDLATAAGCDLYLRESTPSGDTVIQVSAGVTNLHHTAGQSAEVLRGLTAISGDGSRVYFVAKGVLTEAANPSGAVATQGQPNLYLYDAQSATTAFIGTVAMADKGALFGAPVSYFSNATAVPLTGKGPDGEEVGGDGHVLAFASFVPLTADDHDGNRRDVFRYDAEATPATLQCLSCVSTGHDEAFDIAERGSSLGLPLTDFAERDRWASDDGHSVVFSTKEALDADDADQRTKSYLWHDGQLTRLPGVVASIGISKPTIVEISASGAEVAFLTSAALLPADGDSAEDVYVARVDGGFVEPLPSPPCEPLAEGSCQGPPTARPGALPAASRSASGTNVNSGRCPKGRRRVKSGCVKRHQVKHRHHRRAGQKHGGSK